MKKHPSEVEYLDRGYIPSDADKSPAKGEDIERGYVANDEDPREVAQAANRTTFNNDTR